MRKNGAVLTAICILLLFTFNYTLPLRKESLRTDEALFINETKKCQRPLSHKTFMDKVKNMPAHFQNVMRKIRNSTTGKDLNDLMGLKNFSNKNFLSEDDVRQYEQLVIMKKYPYLDIKDLEMKYSPMSSKETRQSVKYHSRLNIPESGICEPAEDNINVEIYNRGLSGFAIPTQLVKHNKMKTDLEIIKERPESIESYGKTPSADKNILATLKDDISTFIQKKEMI